MSSKALDPFDRFAEEIRRSLGLSHADPIMRTLRDSREEFLRLQGKPRELIQGRLETAAWQASLQRTRYDMEDEEEDDTQNYASAADADECKSRRRWMLPPELTSQTSYSVFMTMPVANALEEGLQETFTTTEKAADVLLDIEKKDTLNQHFGTNSGDIWDGVTGFPLSLEEYITLLHSPAAIFLTLEDFVKHRIDIRRHQSLILRQGCRKIAPHRYMVEIAVAPSEGSTPVRFVKEIDVRSAFRYGDAAELSAAYNLLDALPLANQSLISALLGYEYAEQSLSVLRVAFTGTLLERLGEVAWTLYQLMNCPFAEACRFVACGIEPKIPSIRFDGRMINLPRNGLGAIELSIAPFISPETVKQAYELIWRQFHGPQIGQRQTRMKGLALNIYEFVQQQKVSLGITGELTPARRKERKQIYEAWCWSGKTPERYRCQSYFYGIFTRATKAAQKLI